MNNNRKSESVCRVQTGSKTHPHVLNTMVVKVRYNDTTCSAMFYIIAPPLPAPPPTPRSGLFFQKYYLFIINNLFTNCLYSHKNSRKEMYNQYERI